MGRKAWLLVGVLLIAGWAGAQEPTTMTAVAPLTFTSPTLDGVISPGEWADANSYYFDGTDQLRPGWVDTGGPLTAADWSCTFYVKHDTKYVYIATVVTDDVIMNDSGTNQWDDDAMEIYFDPNNSNSNPKENGVMGFQISYKSEDAWGAGGRGLNLWWWAKAVIAPPGYTVEFQIDKAQTGMVTGGKYGFDLSPDDDDDGTGRDNQIWWNAQDGGAWNNEIPWGEIVLSTQPLSLLPAPTELTAEAVSTDTINLAWTDNSTSETAFKIERSPDGTVFTEITTVTANVTAYSDSGLSPGVRYWYQVRAYSPALGHSAYTNVADAITPSGALGVKRSRVYR